MGIFTSLFRVKKRSIPQVYEDTASVIEAFVENRSGDWDWDDFLSIPKDDAYLESVVTRCNRVDVDYPVDKGQKGYCNKEGFEVLRAIAKEVRERLKSIQNEENHRA